MVNWLDYDLLDRFLSLLEADVATEHIRAQQAQAVDGQEE
jgi:hypothetical protein